MICSIRAGYEIGRVRVFALIWPKHDSEVIVGRNRHHSSVADLDESCGVARDQCRYECAGEISGCQTESAGLRIEFRPDRLKPFDGCLASNVLNSPAQPRELR